MNRKPFSGRACLEIYVQMNFAMGLISGCAAMSTFVCAYICNARYVSTVAPPSDSEQSVVLAHYAEVHYENTLPLEAPHD